METTVTEYLYSVSFAVGLCEGEIDRIGRVWADGKPISLSEYTVRIYRGTEAQAPDSAIEAVEGAGEAPAFRGLAYAVFEDLPLKAFGNRVPQLTFEVLRSLRSEDPSALENAMTGVDVIPGSGEFVYASEPVRRTLSEGVTEPENVNNNMGLADAVVSFDALQDHAPNCKTVALVTSWFGTDLRCGLAEVRPGVETAVKTTSPLEWSVGGVSRAGAYVVSQIEGRPAFGGTPSDAVVVQAVKDLKARGLKVVFYPFLLMDIPAGNTAPDPYTGAAGQPAYPWRGRITCDPAPGVVGTPDKTAAAAIQVDALFGAAAVSDFSISGEAVSYSGPAEWTLRRMILHYAHLCKAAGGVDAFLIGSEMRGLTTVRGASNSFPAVAAFRQLASDVRAVLGASVDISYAADWSEYFGYQPSDGSGDIFFHLDPLWADTDIDFVGIDNYMPTSDWRDGFAHLDAAAGWPSIYDRAYQQANMRGGEGYDWFYASAADRDAQTRTPIADGAYGKPWVFRYKDLWNWWSSAHYDRPGGVESVSPTAWVPEAKPLRFTEVGAPAVDKGTNQPNVFIDPKSSESGLPHYSTGRRDDYLQRRFLEAVYDYWATPANNPTSSVYAGPMVALDGILAYAWDARPFPDFPARETVWGDADNWDLGHWLTGRLGRVPLAELVKALAGEAGVTAVDVSALAGMVTGYVVDRPMSPRQMIEPLMQTFQFDAVETGATIRFAPRGAPSSASFDRGGLAEAEEADFSLERAQETDLPIAVSLGYFDAFGEYRHSVAEARLLAGQSDRQSTVEIAAMLEASEAQGIADALLADAWVMRESARFRLPPSAAALEPGDVVSLTLNGRTGDYRLLSVEDGGERRVSAVRTEASVYDLVPGPVRRRAGEAATVFGPPVTDFLDLPLLRGDEVAHAPYVAAFAQPWPGGVVVYRSAGGGGQVLAGRAPVPAVIGELTDALSPGPFHRWDDANALRVRLYGGTLESRSKTDVLGGANVAAIETPNGDWEIVQFRNAALFGADLYELTGLLRGQAGTEAAGETAHAAGTRFVLMSEAVVQLDLGLDQRGLAFDWLYGAEGLTLTDPAFASQTLAFAGTGLRPYRPAHVKAEQAGGDILLSWTRRTRLGGDGWETSDAPLNEESEAYEVDIFNGPTVVRTISTATPSATYADADQIADFGPGGPGAVLTVEIFQMSATFGRGAARRADLPV
ncbi:MAG: glycoside hydrolase/phage tail family protein [Pseudomonadota bacterium]